MKILKQHRGKIVLAGIMILLLGFSYFWGGNTTAEEKNVKEIAYETEITKNEDTATYIDLSSNKTVTTSENSENTTENIPQQKTETDNKIHPEAEVADATQPKEEQKIATPDEVTVVEAEENGIMTCTISIKCDTILDNMNLLEESKHLLIPTDGVILAEKEVTFSEGESVFDILLRETRNNGIHMEFVKSPVYDSAYIEGIHNLYEFDCGELSGWMYSVNGQFPNYGCSNYILNDKDKIEWVYTCNLGNDVK